MVYYKCYKVVTTIYAIKYISSVHMVTYVQTAPPSPTLFNVTIL